MCWSLQEVTQFVAAQSVDETSASLVSLCALTLTPGDAMFIPSCSLIVEKAVGANNVGMRSHCCFMHCRVYNLYKAYRTVFSGQLDLC